MRTLNNFDGYTPVKYYPSYQHRYTEQAEYLSAFCSKTKTPPINEEMLNNKEEMSSEISLVVAYNKPIDFTYLNIMMHYHLFGSYFKNIIFCSNEPFYRDTLFNKLQELLRDAVAPQYWSVMEMLTFRDCEPLGWRGTRMEPLPLRI